MRISSNELCYMEIVARYQLLSEELLINQKSWHKREQHTGDGLLVKSNHKWTIERIFNGVEFQSHSTIQVDGHQKWDEHWSVHDMEWRSEGISKRMILFRHRNSPGFSTGAWMQSKESSIVAYLPCKGEFLFYHNYFWFDGIESWMMSCSTTFRTAARSHAKWNELCWQLSPQVLFPDQQFASERATK